MSVTVAVQCGAVDAMHTTLLTGLRRYRDRHGLAWHIQSCTFDDPAAWPQDAFWVLSKPVARDRMQQLRPDLRVKNPFCGVIGTASPLLDVAVAFDEEHFGRLAAEHCAEQGYRQTCTVQIGGRRTFDQRRESFARASQNIGLAYRHYTRPAERDANDPDRHLLEWLDRQPKPVAVFAVIDGQAAWLRDLILQNGWRIPQDVAILGCGNVLSLCIGAEPELSSVAYPWPLIGEAVALKIHAMMNGVYFQKPQIIRPTTVVARASTAPQQKQDELVQRSVSWLHNNLAHQAPLAGLVAAMAVSEGTLCQRFRRTLGVSPRRKHEQLRMQQAVALLPNPELSIAEIADACGYSSQLPFGVAFKRCFACTPTMWRQANANRNNG